MKLYDLLEKAGNLPVIETEHLLTGMADPAGTRVQMTRWLKSGKLIQLKRGVYVLSDTYRKVKLFEPFLAGILKRPSYISFEKALEYHGLIPEAVAVYTCVTPKRPYEYQSSVGTFRYRHIDQAYFWGYDPLMVNGQTGFMASPEKALLDFFYFKPGGTVTPEYLMEMRLQNTEKLDLEKLKNDAAKFGQPRMLKIDEILRQYIEHHQTAEKVL